jgi:sugar/nucleoside kinase (ribokinase family)
MTSLQPILPGGFKYDHIVGTGGIGSGMFFSIKGNETLGREESRMAALLPYRDYCKQHIIMHYVAVLLGAKANGRFQSYPIGKIGNDDTGSNLKNMMQNAGMTTDHIKVSSDRATLFSICFQYPDHTGGNITTSESASSDVLPADIDNFFSDSSIITDNEIILAVPEVPVETRIRLLQYGKDRGSLNVAAVQSAEIQAFRTLNGFLLTDYLFINLDEARKIAEVDESTGPETVVLTAITHLVAINPSLTVFVTCGAAGVYCYAKKHLEYFPSVGVEVVSTAGAGDAFLAGTIAGLCCGLPLFKKNKETAHVMNTATELGILVASLSVTSQDTIHAGLNKDLLLDFIKERKLKCAETFLKMFENN